MRNFLRLLVILFVLAALPASAMEVYGRSSDDLDIYLGNVLLSQWRIKEAREFVDRQLKSDDPLARQLDAHVKFMEGRYQEAVGDFKALGITGDFYKLVAATAEKAKVMKHKESENFIVYWQDPKDAILADGTLFALEESFKKLSAVLGLKPDDKTRIEIYKTVEDFSEVSTLTMKELETTGTIGLCKFNRLMITSPRATYFGYRWRDTVSHEYLHLLIYRLSMGMAPIWVHEGIARYLEGVWRDREGKLEPNSLALLKRRLAENSLISLEQMSPSIAKLPTAEDADLAFAEVSTMMALLSNEKGPQSLKNLLVLISQGYDAKVAFEEVWGGDFASFDVRWRDYVKNLPGEAVETETSKIKLKDKRGIEEEAEDGIIKDPKAKEFARLGDMLALRNRLGAAGLEYEKALAIEPTSPNIVSKFAMGMLYREEYEKALAALLPVLELYQDREVLWYRKGEALRGLGRYQAAEEAYLEAMELNPFDTLARMGLVDVALKQNKKEVADKEMQVLEIITGEKFGHGNMPDAAKEKRHE